MSAEHQHPSDKPIQIFCDEVLEAIQFARIELANTDFLKTDRIEQISDNLDKAYEQDDTYAQTLKVSGLAYATDEEGGFRYNDDETPVFGYVDLEGFVIRALTIQSPPDSDPEKDTGNHILLEVISETSDEESLELYYMHPEHVLSIETDVVRTRLLEFASRAQVAVSGEDFAAADPERQYDILSEVCHESTQYIASLYLDDLVSVIADKYYALNVIKGKLAWTKMDASNAMGETPLNGIIQGCAFLELLAVDTSEEYSKIMDLVEYQPGIVLCDTGGIPLYLIPFRSFNSLRVKSEDQAE